MTKYANLYDAALDLASDAASARHDQLSDELKRAVWGGTTSGEILANLAGVLREAVGALGDRPDLQKRAADMLEQILHPGPPRPAPPRNKEEELAGDRALQDFFKRLE